MVNLMVGLTPNEVKSRDISQMERVLILNDLNFQQTGPTIEFHSFNSKLIKSLEECAYVICFLNPSRTILYSEILKIFIFRGFIPDFTNAQAHCNILEIKILKIQYAKSNIPQSWLYELILSIQHFFCLSLLEKLENTETNGCMPKSQEYDCINKLMRHRVDLCEIASQFLMRLVT